MGDEPGFKSLDVKLRFFILWHKYFLFTDKNMIGDWKLNLKSFMFCLIYFCKPLKIKNITTIVKLENLSLNYNFR
jgi:hypothetical protein